MNTIAFNIALPLLSAFLLPTIVTSSKHLARFIGPLILLVMLWFAWSISSHQTQPTMIAIGGFLPPLGVSLHLDQLSLLMAMAIPLLLLLLWPYRNPDSRVEALLLLLAGAASGMALSGDLFNIYVFYELLSVATFGLAAAGRSSAAFAATYRYLLMSGVGTVLALTGIALIYTQTGTLNLAHIGLLSAQLDNPVGLSAFALIVIGIGVKAELFPVNGWVPEVYTTASPRVSALLAGLLSKLAVLVMVRLLVVAYGGSEVLLLVLGMLGIVWGELAAWRATDLKRMFAYSSIGQLGMVMVAFSIPGEAGVFAGVAMMLHHMVVKPGLFLLTEGWGHSINSLGGAARLSPVAGTLFILFALSMIGVPPLPGFWAKLLLVTGLVESATPLALTALGVLLTATVIETHYLMRTALHLFATNEHGPQAPSPHHPLTLGVASLFGALLLTALLAVTPLGEKLAHIAAETADRHLYIKTTFPRGVALTAAANREGAPQ
jgi:formate hydrogenlyase subunit 3/multisubunit Na+/H+ antiporter MnhD subunit